LEDTAVGISAIPGREAAVPKFFFDLVDDETIYDKKGVSLPNEKEARRYAITFARGFDHPLALLVDRTGALLVADWGTGVIYRISHRSG